MCEFDSRPVPLEGDEPEWMQHAACTATAPEVFAGVGSVADAKAVCSRCSVQPNCLEYALAAGMTDGVWGGMATPEREVLSIRRGW